ncbi:MAG: type III-B CRISPR-associated protein Cas10/Cmr2 [Zoogloeaceae bacterium]|jgi:CRISPR-associated protein Cmr2|nr:type III-B CRISPR-associated protein Cas10/Cmr2 [Zoogloeaceae bacterium]
MTENTQLTVWQTKVAARLHDPAEKALVLMRDPGVSHEEGSVRDLRERLGVGKGGDSEKRADWWASAADRPALPNEDRWRLIWANHPAIIHPLTGETLPLLPIADISAADAKQCSRAHHKAFLDALLPDGQAPQNAETARRVLLALWRFAPERISEENDIGNLGWLWQQLPADTRIPGHSIWDHLDLVSAFAGAFVADPKGEAALLTMAIGPVQSFIAAARSTSDLWAGSHLLSRLMWETMRPICEDLGPDAVLFPRLRGIPQVDLWLRDRMDLPADLFTNCDWHKSATDANPLFAATLPNRFVAAVPASKATELAKKCETAVREWLQKTGGEIVSRLLKEAGYTGDDLENPIPFEQMKTQLQGFPEVHWAAVPFSLIRTEGKEKIADVSALKAAMSPFFGVGANEEAGFLSTPAWQVLQKEIQWNDNTTFFAPNPGVLYPAVYELAERALAAAKSARTFVQNPQQGWRCSLTGEAEWLTTDRAQLQKSYRQQPDTLWAKIAAKKPSWAKKGEHLSALPAIKRLWPTIFREEVGKALNPEDNGEALDIPRFVVSTHTMALARQLENWDGTLTPEQEEKLAELNPEKDQAILPRKLARDRKRLPLIRQFPALLDAADDEEDEGEKSEKERLVKNILRVEQIETYYALLMLDGDHMGAILSGEHETQASYAKSFHPEIRTRFEQYAADRPHLKGYLDAKRAVSPAQHMAISSALHDFSQTIVPYVVEMEHSGKTLYAGGDDVRAMMPVADLLGAMARLRQAYSGTGNEDKDWQDTRGRGTPLICKSGFAALGGRLMRMMGENATASCGAVIAHHQAPLGAVLRELSAAEKRAKNEGGRDAFSLTIIKRSGGALYLTAKWGEAVETLESLIEFLRDDDVSRRAVYHTLEWLKDLPEPQEAPELLEKMLAYQLDRQAGGQGKVLDATGLAKRLTELAKEKSKVWLENFLTVGEFLARETRSSFKIKEGDRA